MISCHIITFSLHNVVYILSLLPLVFASTNILLVLQYLEYFPSLSLALVYRLVYISLFIFALKPSLKHHQSIDMWSSSLFLTYLASKSPARARASITNLPTMYLCNT